MDEVVNIVIAKADIEEVIDGFGLKITPERIELVRQSIQNLFEHDKVCDFIESLAQQALQEEED